MDTDAVSKMICLCTSTTLILTQIRSIVSESKLLLYITNIIITLTIWFYVTDPKLGIGWVNITVPFII